jgi:hypothetical protein
MCGSRLMLDPLLTVARASLIGVAGVAWATRLARVDGVSRGSVNQGRKL